MAEDITVLGPFRRVFNPLAQFCTWDGQTHYDVINTPVIAGPPVLKLIARVEDLEAQVTDLRAKLERIIS
jgi:hypothetical protein